MNIHRLLPYFLIVIIFIIIYWVTMITPNKTLYLGYALDWDEVIRNNKIPLQLYIFNYGLILCLFGLNLLDFFFTKNSKFWMRLITSHLTILLIYSGCYLVFRQIKPDLSTWNMFYHPRGIPAIGWCIVTLWLTSAGIVSLPIIKKLFSKL